MITNIKIIKKNNEKFKKIQKIDEISVKKLTLQFFS